VIPKPVRDIITSARKWHVARERCRAVADSKSAKPGELDKAKKALSQASDQLSTAVQQFETFLRQDRAQPANPKKNTVNWGAVFGAIANGAKFLETVAAAPKGPHVIDTTGEPVR
jgi:hypothetical protein